MGNIDTQVYLNTVENNSYQGIVSGYSIRARITKNNIINNGENGYFMAEIPKQYVTNSWKNNYWGEPKDKPVRISGEYHIWSLSGSSKTLPVMMFDMSPAKEPYNIEGGLA